MLLGDHMVASNMGLAYPRLLQDLLDHGVEVSPRGHKTKELIDHGFVLINPAFNVVPHVARKVSLPFMAAELMWILTGSNDIRLIAPYNSKLIEFSDDGWFFRGAYGPKVMDQLPYILRTLAHDPSSRQAVLTIWRERPEPSRDIPCTCLMQFFIRQGLLDMLVYMRSNDAWLGLPYDVFNFTTIQQFVARLLNVETGWYHHRIGSLHLYEQHFDKAAEVIKEVVPGSLYSIKNEILIAPMPPEVLTVFTGVSVLDKEITSEDSSTWIDLSGTRRYPDWLDLLLLCAYKFNRQEDLLPPQYQELVRYWKACGA